MKIGILAGGRICFQAVQFLTQNGAQVNLVLPKKYNEELPEVEQFANHYSIPFEKWNKKELMENMASWIAFNQIEVVFVMTFPYIFPKQLIQQIKVPLLNFHFAPLPNYAGAQPIFWLIKNGEKSGGIYIHELVHEIDAGPLLHVEPYKLNSFETFGSYKTMLSELNVKATLAVIQKLQQADWQKGLKSQKQSQLKYRPKPELKNVQIDWQKMNAEEIERLCRACNPWNRGAVTVLKGVPLKLVEVELLKEEKHKGEAPGELTLNTKSDRLIVSTRDRHYLDIHIAYLNEAYYSNFQLQKWGLTKGLKFTS